MKKRAMKIAGTITTIVVLLLSYNHCVVSQKSGKNSSGKSSDSTATINTTNDNISNTTVPETIEDQNVENPNVIVAQTVDVGVKNYEQILTTMGTLTGVSLEDRQIRDTYEDVKDQLPASNDIKSFQSSNQVAIIKLAAEFCNELLDSNALRSEIWPNFDFGRTPNQELDTDGRNYLIEEAIDHFWMLSEQDFSTRLNAKSELNALITDLLVGENLNSSAVTREVGKGVCISTLGSLHAVML